MSDVPTIQERVSRAILSSDLKHRETNCAVDKIGALGMAGSNDVNTMASAVFRLKNGGDAKQYRPALAAVELESTKLAHKHNWTGSSLKFRQMEKACLDFWLNDRCFACFGQGHLKRIDAPYLENDPCPACGGSGKLQPPQMADKAWDERFALLLRRIEDLESQAGRDVMACLANEMSDFR